MTHPANKLPNVRRRAERAAIPGRLGSVTCPASRHLEHMAYDLAVDGGCYQINEEPQHCALTMYSVLESLWKARAEVKRLKEKLNKKP